MGGLAEAEDGQAVSALWALFSLKVLMEGTNPHQVLALEVAVARRQPERTVRQALEVMVATA
jgi:hypothetical protein